MDNFNYLYKTKKVNHIKKQYLMKSITLSSILHLFLLFLSVQIGQAQSSLQNAINALANDVSLRHGTLSVSVIDIESGQLVASHEANRSVIPASSLKVLTTATALGLLGENYTFKTELQYDGSISDGVLNGNLYIKGYGDPTLGSDQMEGATSLENLLLEWNNSIQKAGIRQINGSVVGDASYFESRTIAPSWQWNDIGNYYGAGPLGLNIHENLYYLHFQQTSRLGATPKVAEVSPKIPNLTIHNELRSAGRGTGDNAYIYGAPYSYIRHVRGTIPVGSGIFSIKGSMPDAPLFAADELTKVLQRYGTTVQEAPSSQMTLSTRNMPQRQRTTIFTKYSPALRDIVKRTNMKSINLYCENFVKTLGAEQQKKGTRDAGLQVIKNFWKNKGLDLNGFYIEDGSGLSARNAVTSYHLAKIMQLAARDSRIYKALYDSLPVGGQSGSLKRMFRGTSAVGKIRAKSGTLKRVRSFTGYATTRAGKEVAFSIIVNNFSGSGGAMRKKLEKVMLAMTY